MSDPVMNLHTWRWWTRRPTDRRRHGLRFIGCDTWNRSSSPLLARHRQRRHR